jgi:CheY-like chemotaxis protein
MLGDATRGLAAGFDAYLTKPVDVTQLAAVVSGYVVSGGKTGV